MICTRSLCEIRILQQKATVLQNVQPSIDLYPHCSSTLLRYVHRSVTNNYVTLLSYEPAAHTMTHPPPP